MITNQLLQDQHSKHKSLLTANEVADILNIGRSTVYLLLQRGDLPSVHIGRAVRIRPVDLENFIDRNMNSDNLGTLQFD